MRGKRPVELLLDERAASYQRGRRQSARSYRHLLGSLAEHAVVTTVQSAQMEHCYLDLLGNIHAFVNVGLDSSYVCLHTLQHMQCPPNLCIGRCEPFP